MLIVVLAGNLLIQTNILGLKQLHKLLVAQLYVIRLEPLEYHYTLR